MASCLISEILKPTEKIPIQRLEVHTNFNDLAGKIQQFAIPTDVLKCLSSFNEALPSIQTYYVLVYTNQEPVFFTFFQLASINYQNFKNTPNKGIAAQLMRWLLTIKTVKVLFSGALFRAEMPYFWNTNKAPSIIETATYLRAASTAIVSKMCAHVVVLKELKQALQKELLQLGFQEATNDIHYQIQLQPSWRNIDDYKEALSRKYNARFKKIRTSAQNLQFQKLTTSEIALLEPKLFQLYDQVLSNQAFNSGKISPNYLSHLAVTLDGNFEVFLYTYADEPVAFFSAFSIGDTYEVYYIGFDLKLNLHFNLYFNLLFSVLERAINQQKKILKLGRTSGDAKTSLGAIANIQYAVFQSYLPDFVTDSFIDYLKHYETHNAIIRNPFREVELKKDNLILA